MVREDEIICEEFLGNGSIGCVYKGQMVNKHNGQVEKIPVAIKIFSSKVKTATSNEMLDEIGKLSRIDHPCCIRIIGACVSKNPILLTEFLPQG